jgi:hypothetical protein
MINTNTPNRVGDTMKPLHIFALALVAAFLVPAAAQAQRSPIVTRISPHEIISTHFGRDMVTIIYGRPFTVKPGTTEVRQVFGNPQVVPWDKVWRTGSDEATTLICGKALAFGDMIVPAGVHTIFTFPSKDGDSKFIVNNRIGQWGIPYLASDEKQEIGRVNMTKTTLDKPVDQFTMQILPKRTGDAPNAPFSTTEGTIVMKWELTQFSVDFNVQP